MISFLRLTTVPQWTKSLFHNLQILLQDTVPVMWERPSILTLDSSSSTVLDKRDQVSQHLSTFRILMVHIGVSPSGLVGAYHF